MKLSNKNILLISPEPWNHIFVSKHHYAINLAERGNSVFFLNPPSNQFNYVDTEYDGIYSINYKGFIRGLRYFPKFLQQYFINKEFKKLQNLLKVKFDIVWSFDNSVFFDFKALPSEVFSISHIVDLNQNFEFSKAASSAKMCIGLIAEITEKQIKFNPNTYHITHGVKALNTSSEPIQLPGNNRLKATYIGNLSMQHIDWELIYKLANRFKNEIDFIFIGDSSEDLNNTFKNLVGQLNNIFFLGRVKNSNLSDYLFSSDILFLAYLESYDKDCALPHKLFEYLQTGKIIISNWIQSYKEIISDIEIFTSDNHLNYIDDFKKAIEILHHNSSLRIDKNIDFAKKNSYSNHIREIESIITKQIENTHNNRY